ncbi:MAG: tryptophan--tRNA ligase [Candidatus Sungiibacteriota bacterium]
MTKPILLSGIAPSGVIHIGNYLGAISQWVEMQKTHSVFIMIADLHAITVPQEPKELRENTLRMAKLLIACGINPEQSVLFVQSHVPAHAELAWILNTITPLGELERMTQFKDKKENAGNLAGLFNYPILMAADILLYQTAVVPVGEDQSQHLELTRTLANKFNTRFGETFKIPELLLQKDTARIMGLDDPTKKMSKSAASTANYISLLDEPEEIRRKIKIAVTDSESEIIYNEEQKPAIANLMRIYQAFSDTPTKEIEVHYTGKGYAAFKSDLAELLIEKFAPIQEQYRKLSNDEKSIQEILDDGAKRAHTIAEKTLRDAYEKIGFLW